MSLARPGRGCRLPANLKLASNVERGLRLRLPLAQRQPQAPALALRVSALAASLSEAASGGPGLLVELRSIKVRLVRWYLELAGACAPSGAGHGAGWRLATVSLRATRPPPGRPGPGGWLGTVRSGSEGGLKGEPGPAAGSPGAGAPSTSVSPTRKCVAVGRSSRIFSGASLVLLIVRCCMSRLPRPSHYQLPPTSSSNSHEPTGERSRR